MTLASEPVTDPAGREGCCEGRREDVVGRAEGVARRRRRRMAFSRACVRFAAITCALLAFSTRALADDPPNTPQPMPPPPDNPASADVQDLPFRFRDMLHYEAERARTARYFSGTVFTLSGAAIVTAGVVSFATTRADDPRASGLRAQAYVMMSAGGAAMAGALFLTFMPSSAEPLEGVYSAYAEDRRVSAAKRLYDGVQALRVMARKDMISRRIVGATTIGIGLGLAALAVWRTTLTENTTTDRTISGTLTAASSLATIGAGVSQIWFQRGAAEVALAHWEASQGRLHEARYRPRVTPIITPVLGGAIAGLMLEQ
jgi:hypothetical protein